METHYLTSGHAALRLGIAKGTLLRAMRRGEITPVARTPGGTFRFRVADIDAYAQRLAIVGEKTATQPRRRSPPDLPDLPGAPVLPTDRYAALVMAIAQIVWTTAADGRVVDDLPAWRAYTGQSQAEVLGLGWLDAVHPDERERARGVWERAVARGSIYETEYRLRRADGAYRPFLARATPVADAAGQIQEWVGVCLDLTARYHSEADLRSTVETALDAIITINHTGRIVAFNPAAEQTFGYSRARVLGQDMASLIIPPELRAQHREGLARYLATGDSILLGRRVELSAMRVDGSHFPVEIAVTRIPLDGPPLFTAYIRDITERRQMEEALRHQALHDALTGLPNRTLLLDRMQQAVITTQRERHPLALLLLDLDHFQEVNDTCGHAAGDRLLQQVALRLQEPLRASDTVARLGGDEFAVLLPGSDTAGATLAAQKLLAALEAPIVVDGQTLPSAASIGIALFPEHGADASMLLQHADVALSTAKAARRSYVIYTPAQDPYSPHRLDLIADLHNAVTHGALRLHYQPTVAIATGRVCGVEALVRWPHPRHGSIPPTQFVALAEQTGLIAPLTRWVLEAALRQYQRWRRQGLALAVAVNLSMWDAHDPQLPDTIARLLRAAQAPPEALRLELTESAVMVDAERALDVLTRLSSLGVHLVIDDFGTGYSSLAYLKRLPVDEIKIDQSFVRHMATDQTDAAIVASTIGLAHGLGLRVVAEGVEDDATWRLLGNLECDVAQGYYLSRPLAAPAFARWLRATPWPVVS